MYNEEWKQDANVDEFWTFIDHARTDFKLFVELINKKDRRWLIRFEWLYQEFASSFGQKRYQEFINPTYSEDSQDDLWNEIVGRGQTFYNNVLHHPDKMPQKIDYSDIAHNIKLEIILAYNARFGSDFPAYGYGY